MEVPSKAVIDTCVLLDALIINFIKTEITSNKDSRKIKWEQMVFENDANYRKNYVDYLDEIQTFVTSSHAVGELQRLAISRLDLDDKTKIQFWKRSSVYLRYKNFDEHLIKLLSISENPQYAGYVFDIGYIDTSIIELARETKLPIVTNDSKTLYNRASNIIGVKIVVPKNDLRGKFR